MSKISTNNLDNLKLIVKYFDKGQLSAFIGAGFSKNASQDFPDWDELLSKMVCELYEEEIESSANKEKIIKRIIKRQGTTLIPEEFVKYKGRREDLTTYIQDTISPIDSNIEISDLAVHRQLLELPWVDVCTTNYDTVLEQANELIGAEWTMVESSDGLSKNPKKRIIKLHGNIGNKSASYSFDGSNKHQYIITKSDYDNYPKEHYGFTTFMQSKILQESLCMIGFSGNDPNFKSWIYWVRDLLNYNNSEVLQNPIFLLDVSDSGKVDRSNSTELFFKNHNINRIILTDLFDWLWHKNNPHPEFKNIVKPENDIKHRLLEFFQYIKGNINWNNPMVQVNTLPFQKDEYYSFWDKQLNSKKVLDATEKITTIKDTDFPRLPAPYAITRANYAFLTKINMYWQNSYDFWTLIDNCIMHTNNYLMLPLHYLSHDKFNYIEDEFLKLDIKELINDKEIITKWINYSILILKTYRMINDKKQFDEWKNRIIKTIGDTTLNLEVFNNAKQEINYQTGLYYAYSLDLENLDKFLSLWLPEKEANIQGQWLIKKARLLNQFNRTDKEISDIIMKLYDKALSIEKNPQEKLWILENYGVILQGRTEETAKVRAEINSIKSSGYVSLNSITDYLLERKSENPEILPIDSIRNKGKSYSIGGIAPEFRNYYKALQYFYLVDESGLLLAHQNCVWNPLQENYMFFKEIENDYLEMCISQFWPYVGNHSNEEALRKRSQDILFSDNISLELKTSLLKKMIGNFTYCRLNNKRIREVFFLISELMRTVEYSVWSSFWNELFYNILDEKENNEWERAKLWFFRDNVWGWRIPINQILPLVDNVEDVTSIVKPYLMDIRLNEVDLSSIKLNPHFKTAFNKILKIEEFNKKIICISNKKIIELYPLLDINNKEKLASQIDRNNLDDYHLELLFTVMPDLEINDLIFSYTLKKCSEYIINLPEKSYPNSFPIYKYISTIINLDDFNKKYSNILLKKYLSVWKNIKRFIHNEQIVTKGFHTDSIINSNILPYYDYFRSVKKYIENLPEFISFYSSIENISSTIKQVKTNIDIIMNDEIHDFEKISSQIIHDQINYPYLDLKKSISLILNRIIFVDHIRNENILFYLFKLFFKYYEDENFMNYFKDLIVLVLQKYKNNFLKHDRILLEDYLIRITELFEPYIVNNSIIDYWKKVKIESHYYEVRNLTKLYINKV